MNLTWTYLPFGELDASLLYEILKLRSMVFVVEQNCVYQDLDDKDRQSYHLCGFADNQLVAYTRILPPKLAFEEASIGRVITHPDYRRFGFGIELMKRSIELTLRQYNTDRIRIGAQCYLKKFYGSLGFMIDSEEYLEDGIPHVEMIWNRTEKSS